MSVPHQDQAVDSETEWQWRARFGRTTGRALLLVQMIARGVTMDSDKCAVNCLTVAP
jgi:hypothetical protein